ncbi:MAG: DNA-binding protein WhiA [Lachnospiraceae bacterium]|nr:DNA-binding protein WhiA [Lachnospiraceae bacterium]
MSFSGDTKEELSRQISRARHCQIAEIAAIISLCGRIQINVKNQYCLRMQTENAAVARKYFTLIKKAFEIRPEVSVRQGRNLNKAWVYMITIPNPEDSLRILQAVRLIDEDGEINENLSITDNIIIQQRCCKRAFLRGAFLAAGSISDPEKFYHFEIVCASESKAEQLRDLILSFDIDARIVQRKKYYVVYIKEGAMIVLALNVMEANVSLMQLENIRILKEMRNSVNRKVNCETANLNKTVSAAVRQAEDIQYIKEHAGLDSLPAGLGEMAQLRLEHPDASLKELGMMLCPQVGKSGVNHRLRKISDIAEALRDNFSESQ